MGNIRISTAYFQLFTVYLAGIIHLPDMSIAGGCIRRGSYPTEIIMSRNHYEYQNSMMMQYIHLWQRTLDRGEVISWTDIS